MERRTGISSASRRAPVGSGGGEGAGRRRCSGEGGDGDAARAGQGSREIERAAEEEEKEWGRSVSGVRFRFYEGNGSGLQVGLGGLAGLY